MSDLEMKSFGPFEIKSEDRGEVVAIVATLGVVDKDGDVILPGALPPGGAKVKLSGYDHDTVLKSVPPVGKGIIVEQGNALVFKGNFFMSTERGREAFNYTKEMGQDGEWSFGFLRATKNAPLTDEWRAKGAKRLIAGMKAFEASPVFEGAGWGTGTVMTKAAEESVVLAQASIPADPEVAEVAKEYGDVTEVPVVLIADPDPEATAAAHQAEETEEQKAAHAAELDLKARVIESVEEFQRVQRALRRMGYAA
jgi:hypothetical protein